MSILPPVRAFAHPLSKLASEVSGNATPFCSVAPIVAIEHLKWARTIARGVRQQFRFQIGSQEEQDLEATAYLALVELVPRFDLERGRSSADRGGAFRGWASIEIRTRCQREARRLRNGGTYNTRRELPGKALVVVGLSEKLELIDPRMLEEPEEDDPDDLERC